MDLGIRGRVAAVAAGSRGLGRACALALAAEGADVAICARGEESLRATERDLAGAGVRARALPLDLTAAGSCEQFVDETVASLGGLDILVANNGGPAAGPVASFSDQQWHEALDANLLVTVRLARAALPHMRARGWGRIVAITSYAVKQPQEGLGLSNAARAGATGFLKTLATEVARDGITVNAVLPGPFRTHRITSLAEQRAAADGISLDEALRAWGDSIPVGRVGEPEEFGALVAFLAGEQAAFITGASIQIDGGAIRSIL